MYDNIERELKLLINENIYNKLLHSYDFHNPITQTNTYFDTENQDVKKQHGAVRIRTIQNKKIFTLKSEKMNTHTMNSKKKYLQKILMRLKIQIY